MLRRHRRKCKSSWRRWVTSGLHSTLQTGRHWETKGEKTETMNRRWTLHKTINKASLLRKKSHELKKTSVRRMSYWKNWWRKTMTMTAMMPWPAWAAAKRPNLNKCRACFTRVVVAQPSIRATPRGKNHQKIYKILKARLRRNCWNWKQRRFYLALVRRRRISWRLTILSYRSMPVTSKRQTISVSANKFQRPMGIRVRGRI